MSELRDGRDLTPKARRAGRPRRYSGGREHPAATGEPITPPEAGALYPALLRRPAQRVTLRAATGTVITGTAQRHRVAHIV